MRKAERDGASRGREIFQQKNICDRIPCELFGSTPKSPTAILRRPEGAVGDVFLL